MYLPQDDDEKDEIVLTAGEDPMIRKWNLIEETEISTYKVHTKACIRFILMEDYIISIGRDKTLAKFDMVNEVVESSYKAEDQITAF